jgi:hypothetical protein
MESVSAAGTETESCLTVLRLAREYIRVVSASFPVPSSYGISERRFVAMHIDCYALHSALERHLPVEIVRLAQKVSPKAVEPFHALKSISSAANMHWPRCRSSSTRVTKRCFSLGSTTSTPLLPCAPARCSSSHVLTWHPSSRPRCGRMDWP